MIIKNKPKHYVTPERAEYQAVLLANRLKKRYKHFAKRYRRYNIEAFRLYDRDIPEIRAVVDWYAGHLVVGEYVRTQTGPEWLPRMAAAAGEALKVPKEKIFVKQRRTKSATAPRYGTVKQKGQRFSVTEGDMKFWVDLGGALDTGLFSDHRLTRTLVRDMAKGKDFLNLFAYTATFSCAAALGGARSIVTVDRSSTYLDWGEDNFKLNKIADPKYTFVRADTEEYIDAIKAGKRKFTLAFVDPPSFSQRRGASGVFDINTHHVELLEKVFTVMAPGSTVIFSTNHQRFDPKLSRLKVKKLEELTPKTIPEDYFNKLVHRCWKIDL